MFKVAVGHSDDPDTASAAAELIEQCRKTLDGTRAGAGILFSAIDHDHGLLCAALCDAFDGVELCGCTTDGEISSVLAFQQDSATLILFASDQVEIRAGLGENAEADPAAAARAAVEQACAGLTMDPALCILLPESLTADGLAILEGVRTALPPGVPISGGLAADQWQFKQTWQFHGRRVLSDAVAVLIFGGPLICSHGVASGWNPVGERCTVTRSVDNDLFEIDGQSALQFYRNHLGAHLPSSNYPLVVYEPDGSYYLRAPSGEIDEEAGSVAFFANVPEGAQVQMSETTRDDVLSATRDSMQQALDSYAGSKPAAAMYFSCASRRQLLGTRTREEYDTVRTTTENPLPACGFYTNGEISPQSGRQDTQFHNETFITLLLGTE